MIYRVTVKTTGSVQPDRSTFWQRDVIYCGTDLEAARVAFLRSKPEDVWRGYGNRCRTTEIEEFESEPDEIDSEESETLEVEE